MGKKQKKLQERKVMVMNDDYSFFDHMGTDNGIETIGNQMRAKKQAEEQENRDIERNRREAGRYNIDIERDKRDTEREKKAEERDNKNIKLTKWTLGVAAASLIVALIGLFIK
jgi:hypothetical protein